MISWRFVTIAGLFVTALVVSNIIAVKLVEVSGRVFPAGLVVYYLTSNVCRIGQQALIEERLRWLSSWTIHHANHVRDSADGLKVGGHQASCASMTATAESTIQSRALSSRKSSA